MTHGEGRSRKNRVVIPLRLCMESRWGMNGVALDRDPLRDELGHSSGRLFFVRDVDQVRPVR